MVGSSSARWPRGALMSAEVAAPTLIMHGTADQMVPISHAEWLADTVRGADRLLVARRRATPRYLTPRRTRHWVLGSDQADVSTAWPRRRTVLDRLRACVATVEEPDIASSPRSAGIATRCTTTSGREGHPVWRDRRPGGMISAIRTAVAAEELQGPEPCSAT